MPRGPREYWESGDWRLSSGDSRSVSRTPFLSHKPTRPGARPQPRAECHSRLHAIARRLRRGAANPAGRWVLVLRRGRAPYPTRPLRGDLKRPIPRPRTAEAGISVREPVDEPILLTLALRALGTGARSCAPRGGGLGALSPPPRSRRVGYGAQPRLPLDGLLSHPSGFPG